LDFQKQNDVVFIEEQSSSSAAYLVELNSELARLNKERDLLLMESKDPLVNSGYNGKSENTALNPDAPPSKASDPTTSQNILPQNSDPISEQEDRIEKLKISSDQLGIYLKDKHPKMIDLANQIDREQKFLEALKDRNVTAQDAYREDLGLRIKNLESQIETANANSLKLSESLGAYQQLKNKLNRDEALYNQLALSIQNVDFNKSLDQEDIVILEAASKARPVLLDTALRLAYGFEGGLAAGMALIYFVYRLDDKIDSASQLEENFDLPILGQIPRVPADKQTKRVTLLEEGDQRHEYLEYHCHLRSAILFQSFEAKPMTTYVARTHAGRLFPNMVWIDEVTAYGPCPGGHLHTSNTGEHDCRIKIDNVPKMYCVHTSCRNEIEAANQALQLGTPGAKLRSLMICSAVPGEGKSTLAGNMAIVLAYSGLRVLLIDADLRRGILHTLFEVQANPGLSNYVMKEVSWREVVHETKVANLSLLPRGKSLHRAGDLLLSSAVDSLLQESTTAFDLVLWDSPPLLAAHDAANLCSKMDGILFVARFRFSSIISIRSALEDLSKRNAKILGFVLNATEHSQPGYSDKYRYKEYYGVTPAAD
jgi:capsular exopolysaccharide synthesis family protein